MSNFSLEKEYQNYLQRMGLSEEKIHPQQRVEIKRAFMGACSQMLVLFTDGVADLEEVEGVRAIQSLFEQAEDYWKSEIENYGI